MTYIVQLTMPASWPVHITWIAMELAVMAWGSGQLIAPSEQH
jgi:putative oxidoreductase